jgi:hypothetical protein
VRFGADPIRATYRPFKPTAFLILALRTGASTLGLQPTRIKRSVSSIPAILEFVKY